MSENQQPTPDPLDEAIAAFQRMAVPKRPPDAEVLASLGAPREGTTRPVLDPTSLKRRYLMRLVVPSAAAVLLVAGGLGVWLLNGTAPIALAQVVQAAEKHKLVRYKQTQTDTHADGTVATLDNTVYADLKALRFRAESRHRFMDPDDRLNFIAEVNISVQDPPNNRWLMTNTHAGGKVLPPRKDAWLGRIGEERKNWKSFLENLKEFQQKKGVTSGKDTLGGREMIRFRLEEDNKMTALWVDAKTRLPFRMEHEIATPTVTYRFVQTDFEWDPPLPKGIRNLDELFSTTPPKGYTLDDQTQKGQVREAPKAVAP
jgi:hypothetical protein